MIIWHVCHALSYPASRNMSSKEVITGYYLCDQSSLTPLITHSYQTPAGAWLVKLCPDPLDLDRLDHVKLFAGVYARFPKIGLRAPVKEPLPPVRYPEHTVYINEGNLRYVSERLASFLKDRGFKIFECLSIGTKECITLGLFQGEPDWTIIKTLPEEFLAEVLPGEKEPLLIALCRELQCGGCMLNVYNDIEAILLETDAAGRKNISGFFDAEKTPDKVKDFQRVATENPSVVEFKLLPIEIDMLDLDNCGQLAEQLHAELAGRNADLCNNHRLAEAINGRLLKDRQGIKLCFTR